MALPDAFPMTAAVAPSTRRMALLLAGLAMFGPFSIDTIFPAFPQLAQRLAVDEVAVQQTISVYLLFYGLMSLAHGPLSDAWGRKRVILGGLVVFVGASVGCALSTDLTTLLAFRALQGLSAGVGMIVGRAVIRDLYHGHDAQRLMSQVSMLFGIAPAIAPIIGGWILLSGAGWPLIFWFLVMFALLLLAATARYLPETHPVEARVPLSPRVLLRDYVRIGFNPRFLRLALAGSIGFGGIFLYISSAPVFVMQHLHLGEGGFAWLFIPTIGGMTTGSFLSGRMAGHTTPTRQVSIGFGLCALSVLLNVGYGAVAAVRAAVGGDADLPGRHGHGIDLPDPGAGGAGHVPASARPGLVAAGLRAADDQHGGGRRGVAAAQRQPAAPGAGAGRVLRRRLRVLVLGTPA